MDLIPDLELVKCAFPPVSVIVTNIALRRRHGQLGELGAHLCSFALEIQELTSQQTLAWEQHVTLHDILTEVENVISVSKSSFAKQSSRTLLIPFLLPDRSLSRMQSGTIPHYKRLRKASTLPRTKIPVIARYEKG